MSTSKIRKKSRSRYCVQPWWQVNQWCHGLGKAAPPVRPFDANILDLIREKKMGLDVFSYYLYRMCHNQLTSRWMTTEAEDLGVTPKTLKRFRSELRKHGLMTTVRLGTQTYTVSHQNILSEADQKRMAAAAFAAFKSSWAVSKRLGIDSDFRAVLEMLQLTASAVSMPKKYVLRRPLLFSLCNLLPASKGIDRLKAVGLWVLLLHSEGHHFNWKSPEHIATRVKILSPNTARKLCAQLLDMGLMFYCPKRKLIALSLFPRGRWEHLNPLNFKPLADKTPWLLFRHERLRPAPDIWERERKEKPKRLMPMPRPPLGYSRQPRVNSEKTESIRATIAYERAQNELRLTGSLGWTPSINSSAQAEVKAEAVVDLQRYADGG
jgi:hypothetical protein